MAAWGGPADRGSGTVPPPRRLGRRARSAGSPLLDEQGVDDVVLTVGGTIPADDIPELKRLGVAEVFTPGASTQDIIDFIQDAVRRRGAR